MNTSNKVYKGDSIKLLKDIEDHTIDLIVSDIPYGIGVDTWDVLHDNTNHAYLGSSPAQERAGAIFKKRGKPLNGWSESDRLIPKQYYDWVASWASEWFRIIKPGANVFVFAGRRLSHRCICALEDIGFTYKDMIGWEKRRAAHRAQRISIIFERRSNRLAASKWQGWKVGNLRPVFEPILWFSKPYKIGGTIADNVLQYNLGAFNECVLKKYGQESDNIFHIQSQSCDTGLHPTQKPLKLIELLIELTTIEGQIVCDPFCGSGTTLVAALRLNRKYLGFEKEEKYYNITLNRVSKESDELKNMLFKNGE
ncbi:MAG: site-specific DNA-methyltransferase [Planctomycetaceae bacterium]|jgi:site-specific DNA-methyltransferase (adenine-specific)|nr:site-specific DNA-methyltransferase [Planctomycetaceae bacterium]